jgi:hypothetical protein
MGLRWWAKLTGMQHMMTATTKKSLELNLASSSTWVLIIF